MSASSALEVWLGTFTSEKSKSQYKSLVKVFMHFIYREGDVHELADRYLKEKRDNVIEIMKDIDKYWASCSKYTPKTRANKMSGVKIFLRDNYVELPETFWQKFRIGGEFDLSD